MKNPCENCLIFPMCIDACNPYIAFAREMYDKYDFLGIPDWIKKYEIRPRILDKYKDDL